MGHPLIHNGYWIDAGELGLRVLIEKILLLIHSSFIGPDHLSKTIIGLDYQGHMIIRDTFFATLK